MNIESSVSECLTVTLVLYVTRFGLLDLPRGRRRSCVWWERMVGGQEPTDVTERREVVGGRDRVREPHVTE